MKVAKMKSHNFPLLYQETFRKIKLKVWRGQSGHQLSELLWAWGNPVKERQQKEATPTYLEGLLILQSQQLLREGSTKLAQSVIPWMVPCSAANAIWPAPSFAASSCLELMWHSQTNPLAGILCTALSLLQGTELVENIIWKWGLKTRYVGNRLTSSDLFTCVYRK